MEKYNPDIHHRRSIRLKGYDYSHAGLYFVTICCQNKANFFGEIDNDLMALNDAGKMIEKWYYELGNKFPDKKCHEMIIMPNHFHCIIENMPVMVALETGAHVGVPLRGYPFTQNSNKKFNASIGDAINWFKTMTTNEYIRGVKILNWKSFDKRIWQRNYWEHIIRNENEFIKISDYVRNNPIMWHEDTLNGGAGNFVMESSTPYNEEKWMV